MPSTENIITTDPVVIGGLGGSGTRVVAGILKELDFYLGDYMNEQLDNLWFTFLFRRPRTFRSFKDTKIIDPIRLFDSIMKNNLRRDWKTRIKLYAVGTEYVMYNYMKGKERLSFPANCIKSILHNNHETTGNWGWKEPNSHLFIDSLANYYPGMKYILVLRHPLDMVFGNNYLQLLNWHHLFNLPHPNNKNREELMLSYYNLANSRAIQLGEKLLGNNFMAIKFEDVCQKKSESITRLLSFLNIEADEVKKSQLTSIIQPPDTLYRYKNSDWSKINGVEEICQKFGYVL